MKKFYIEKNIVKEVVLTVKVYKKDKVLVKGKT